ncbi:MAG: hypothetical protein ACYTGB_04855 [Planctomycetota bacterium]|jgi:hypothetical protein
MIVSDIHRYIYIGIPRTGSKSMNHWLSEHFDGRNLGGHHDYIVPDEFADYLVFTVVRNPYDRRTSGHFAVTWDDQAPTEEELEGCRNTQERLRRFREVLKSREAQRQREMPEQSEVSLEQRIREAALANEGEGAEVNQKRIVERGGVKLVLYFERLPECLTELPFVGAKDVPVFPHHPERGIRPAGDFFEFFKGTDEEQVVWAYAAEDFEAFGYRRYESGLPEGVPDALRMPGA